MTHEQHMILDDGPRAGLLAPDVELDSDPTPEWLADFKARLAEIDERGRKQYADNLAEFHRAIGVAA